MSGVRVNISVRGAAGCPLTGLSDGEGRHESIGRNQAGDGETIEEFVTPVSDPDCGDDAIDFEPTFSYGSGHVFQFRPPDQENCPRDSLEQHDCVLLDCYVTNHVVHLSFHAPDAETLGAIVESLKDDHDGVKIEQILRTSNENKDDLVVFDQSRLTDRQREVLETANEMGYFERPRKATAEEVASELGIVPSTFSEHLGAAQRKLLDSLLEQSA